MHAQVSYVASAIPKKMHASSPVLRQFSLYKICRHFFFISLLSSFILVFFLSSRVIYFVSLVSVDILLHLVTQARLVIFYSMLFSIFSTRQLYFRAGEAFFRHLISQGNTISSQLLMMISEITDKLFQLILSSSVIQFSSSFCSAKKYI